MNDIRVQPQNNFHNYKGKKKSLPISINSNILPCQFIFSKPTSKIATSYINIGQKIQKSNHQKTKSINSNNVLMNPYIIMMNNNSRITNNSLIKTNQNLTSIINNNKKIDNSNSISNRDTFYHSRKKTPVYFKKSRQNSGVYCYNISKNLSKNNSLLASKPIKKQIIKNFNFNNNPTYSNLVNLIKKSNYGEKDNINKRYITLNGNHKKNNKSCNNYTLNNKRMLSHENISIPINQKLTNHRNKEIEINKENLFKHTHSISINKIEMNNFLKNSKEKKEQDKKKPNIKNKNQNKKNNIPRAEIRIDLNKFLQGIKVHKNEIEEKKQEEKGEKNIKGVHQKSNSKSSIKEIEPLLCMNNNDEINKKNEEEEKKVILSEPNIIRTTKNIFNEDNELFNELFSNNNLHVLTNDIDDKFDDLNSIVRKIKFNFVILNKESIFSKSNKIYNHYKELFDFEYDKIYSKKYKNDNFSSGKENNKISDRKNYNNISFSTQSGSSCKKAFQNSNTIISPVTNKFDLNNL
jgi:hypothetical protein